ncbi:MAG: glycosyltransferase family 39 protein [Patescibacteria group bacterium]
MKSKPWVSKKHWIVPGILIGIMLFGAVIRFFNLAGPDLLNDEALYAMRSVEYFDYIASTNIQTTPIIWFPEHVWWQGLSFHDAPPLVFAVQWFFFKIFGETVFASRLPFVLAGLLAIYGTFLLARLMTGNRVAILAAGIMAAMNYHVWISRIGFLDGFVIVSVIFSLYFFLRAEKDPRLYLAWGTFVGLGLLTKYTFLFMGPVFLLMILLWRRNAFRNRWFWTGVGVFLAFISPVIVYNVMMVVTRGHPDAALSTMIGLHPDDFRGLTRGASFGLGRIGDALQGLRWGMGPVVLISLAGAFLFGIIAWIRHKSRSQNLFIILLSLTWILLMLGVTGGGDRYGVVVLPFVVIAVAWAGIALFAKLQKQLFKISFLVVSLLLFIWEGIFMVQSQLLSVPIISHTLLVMDSRPEWLGYNALEALVADFYRRHPDPSYYVFAQTPQIRNYQIDLIQAIHAKGEDRPQQTHMLVFDDRMDWFPTVWIFERRRTYDVAMIPSLTNLVTAVDERYIDKFIEYGFREATIIITTENTPHETNANADRLERFAAMLRKQYPVSAEIKNAAGEVAFEMFVVPLGPELDSFSEAGRPSP